MVVGFMELEIGFTGLDDCQTCYLRIYASVHFDVVKISQVILLGFSIF